MERKIGEQFEYDGITLEVVKQESCEGCYFFNIFKLRYCNNSEIKGHCLMSLRSDKKMVIFKEVTK